MTYPTTYPVFLALTKHVEVDFHFLERSMEGIRDSFYFSEVDQVIIILLNFSYFSQPLDEDLTTLVISSLLIYNPPLTARTKNEIT